MVEGQPQIDPKLLLKQQNELKAREFFEFIGHPYLADQEMHPPRLEHPIMGKEFWEHCGHIVGPMVETVKNMEPDNPAKAEYMSSLVTASFLYAGIEPVEQQMTQDE